MNAVDTNILVYAHRQDSSLHSSAFPWLKKIAEGNQPWGICFHSFVEFYGIVSHPKIWTEPSSPEEVERQISAWMKSPSLVVLTESESDLSSLLSLASNARIKGPMIHDTRIANCCLANGVTELWSVDRDFSRFPELKTRNPL